jgi:hypothetical protein
VPDHKFLDLPEDFFPIKMEARDADGAIVWEETITGPAAIYIPPLRERYGPVSIRVTYADGRITEASPLR